MTGIQMAVPRLADTNLDLLGPARDTGRDEQGRGGGFELTLAGMLRQDQPQPPPATDAGRDDQAGMRVEDGTRNRRRVDDPADTTAGADELELARERDAQQRAGRRDETRRTTGNADARGEAADKAVAASVLRLKELVGKLVKTAGEMKKAGPGEDGVELKGLMEKIQKLLDLLAQVPNGGEKQKLVERVERAIEQFALRMGQPEAKQGSLQPVAAAKAGGADELDKLLDEAVELLKGGGPARVDGPGREEPSVKDGAPRKDQRFAPTVPETAGERTQPQVEVRDLRINDPRRLGALRHAAGSEGAKRDEAAAGTGKAEGTQGVQPTAVQPKSADGGRDWMGEVKPAGAGGKSDGTTAFQAFADRARETQRAGGAEGIQRALQRDPQEVFRQIVDRARITHRSGMSEMRVDLRPQELGRIAMRFTVEDGAVSARISVANDTLRDWLKDNADSLVRELAAGGVPVTRLDVDAQASGSFAGHGFAPRGDEGRLAAGSAPGAGSGPAADTPRAPVRARRSHAGAVDLVA